MVMRSAERKLRVLSIAHSAVNRSSGRVRYERLDEIRADIDLSLLAPDRWYEYGKRMPLDPHSGPLDFRVECVRFPVLPKIGWYAHFYPRLSRLLRDIRPDVIHAWEEPWSVVGFQVVRLRDQYLPEAAVVLETDQNIRRILPPPFEQIRRYNLRRIDLLIGRQEESLQVSKACGFSGRTAIVEYGVASAVFAPGDRNASRHDLGVSGFVIGYVGRIVREKGLLDVLDALALCSHPITFVVMGSGPDQEAFQTRIAELGLTERVRVLSPRPPVEVARFINALDVLVLMSRTTKTWKEQFGRVIMEAHACGVPVIGSDSGSIPGVVANGGWICPEGSSGALAETLSRVFCDPTEVAVAGASGRRQALTRFSIDRVAENLADSWFHAVDARRKKRAASAV